MHILTITNLGTQMKGVDVLPTSWRHLPLKMQGEVISQEVARSQSGAAIQSTLTNIQANYKI